MLLCLKEVPRTEKRLINALTHPPDLRVSAPSRSLELGSRVILARCPDRSVKKEEEMFLCLECGHFISRIYSRSNTRITSRWSVTSHLLRGTDPLSPCQHLALTSVLGVGTVVPTEHRHIRHRNKCTQDALKMLLKLPREL
ncbi:unnamed protein product [Pleuronectes platessa]|uniref:Uncharacterized protein n=1 Tax=Pleuronectes platessa TaxID=8262 RepID=A0A9N7Y6Y5_PLEPL|nr:unnamed protein product [Pleuronectes platessa]